MTFFSTSPIPHPCSSTFLTWLKHGSNFLITVTAVTVLTCIGNLPLLYSPKASCYLCNFLSKVIVPGIFQIRTSNCEWLGSKTVLGKGRSIWYNYMMFICVIFWDQKNWMMIARQWHMEVSLYLNEHVIVSAALEIYDNRRRPPNEEPPLQTNSGFEYALRGNTQTLADWNSTAK